MRIKTYIVVCAMAALGLSFASPNAASAFPAAAGTGKAYTQTVSGTESIPVRWGRGGWGGGRAIGFGRGVGWGGRGWGGVGLGRGIGWGGGGRGAGWRGGYGGWGGNGWGWGWPVGLGLGLAAASTYPAWGGGYYGTGYGGCSCGGW